MQAESSLWGRKRVVGSKLKHDGTLGFISRGAARRSGLNPAGWHRYVPIAVVAAGVAPQRGIVAAASTIADAQKDEDEQGDSAETTHANETTTTPSAR